MHMLAKQQYTWCPGNNIHICVEIWIKVYGTLTPFNKLCASLVKKDGSLTLSLMIFSCNFCLLLCANGGCTPKITVMSVRKTENSIESFRVHILIHHYVQFIHSFILFLYYWTLGRNMVPSHDPNQPHDFPLSCLVHQTNDTGTQ